jgi:hypothetical protein
MNRLGLCTLIAVTCFGSALAQVQRAGLDETGHRYYTPPAAARRAPTLNWNSNQTVLFKGNIKGLVESAPLADGKSWTTLLVKLGNGGTAMVELGPRDYVNAQGLHFRMNAPVWVAGSKVYDQNGGSVILAQRLNFDESRPSFRRADGKPFWER